MADQLSLTLPQLRKRLERIERPMPVGLVTITTPAMTQLGVILGTAAYMSPEQVGNRMPSRPPNFLDNCLPFFDPSI